MMKASWFVVFLLASICTTNVKRVPPQKAPTQRMSSLFEVCEHLKLMSPVESFGVLFLAMPKVAFKFHGESLYGDTIRTRSPPRKDSIRTMNPFLGEAAGGGGLGFLSIQVLDESPSSGIGRALGLLPTLRPQPARCVDAIAVRW